MPFSNSYARVTSSPAGSETDGGCHLHFRGETKCMLGRPCVWHGDSVGAHTTGKGACSKVVSKLCMGSPMFFLMGGGGAEGLSVPIALQTWMEHLVNAQLDCR